MYKQTILLAILLSPLLAFSSEKASAQNIEYFSSYEYLSSVQSHYLAVGARAEFRNVTFEISNGIKKAARSERNANKYSNGTLIAVHLYPFHPPQSRYRFLVTATHLSDIFRGKPFNDRAEPVDHFFGIGLTTKSERYEADLIIGKESHDCSLDRDCEYSNQFKTTVRYFF